MTTTLRPMQEEDVQMLLRHRLRVLVANAPGTGKTPTTVTAIARSWRQSTPALIIAPPSVLQNWKREFGRWGAGLRVQVQESADDFPKALRTGDVLIIGWPLIDPRLDELQQVDWRCIVADEAHFAKNPDAARSQALRALCTPERGLILLTGTPIVNSTDEMEQLESLYGGKRPPRIRRLLSEVAPDIPEKSRAYLYVEMPAADKREYDQAHHDFENWLRKERSEMTDEGYSESEIERKLAAEALVKIGYLRRILGKAKALAAADFAARAVRLGEPVVFFCEHQAVVARLVKSLRKFRIRHGLIDGTMSPKKRQATIDAFQANEIAVIICTKAGKEGITLHAARHLVFIERFYTAADEEQAEDRIRRIGQQFRTTIWYLHVQATVDDRVDVIVRSKRQIIEDAIGGEDIAETDLHNIEQILNRWEHTIEQRPKGVNLGLSKPLPPLPSPSETHMLIFRGARWNRKGAKLWCKMNGYLDVVALPTDNHVKLRVHGTNRFKPQSFRIIPVSNEIRAVVGEVRDAATRKGLKSDRKTYGRRKLNS